MQSYSNDLLSLDFAAAAPAATPVAAPIPAASGHSIATFAQPTTDALGQALTSTSITPGPTTTVPSVALNTSTGTLPMSPQFGAGTIAQIPHPNHPPTNQQYNMHQGTHPAGHQMQQLQPQPSHHTSMQPQQGIIQNAGQQMNPSHNHQSTPVQPAAQYQFDPFS